MKTLKQEEVDGRDYRDLEQARQEIGGFIEEVYNRRRLHSALAYQPPAEFEADLAATRRSISSLFHRPRKKKLQRNQFLVSCLSSKGALQTTRSCKQQKKYRDRWLARSPRGRRTRAWRGVAPKTRRGAPSGGPSALPPTRARFERAVAAAPLASFPLQDVKQLKFLRSRGALAPGFLLSSFHPSPSEGRRSADRAKYVVVALVGRDGRALRGAARVQRDALASPALHRGDFWSGAALPSPALPPDS